MISSGDILSIPYTPDLTEGGITYAVRSLPHTYNRMGGSPFDRLRRIVAGVGVELAFRRHLTQLGVPFDIRGATPFTDPDRYDVSLGGHRCDIKSFLITHRDQIAALHRDPGLALEAPALVPLDQLSGEGHSETDLYFFAFLTGLVASSPEDLKKVMQAGQPIYMMQTMPAEWMRPKAWVPLGPLVLKSESDESLQLELGGQDASREFMTESVELPPRTRLELPSRLHSLAYLHATTRPKARVGLRSARRAGVHIFEPTGWGNIWVYGMDIFLAGWISREEFRRRAALVHEGSHVFQYDRTRTKNLAVPIRDLKPLPDLFERVREWENKGK